MDFLFMLEDSALGAMVSSSIWGYPIVLSLHALGMATLVGISLMLSFRTLGFASKIPVTSLAPYWRIAQAGFVVNLLSGTALFFGSASSLAFNWPFRIKIVMVIIGLLLTRHLVKVCIKGDGLVTSSDRTLAAVAVLIWVGALIAGRLIGYVF